MINHPLVKHAKRYPVPTITSTPDTYMYKSNVGYWVIRDSGLPMMMSNLAIVPATKKCDRETGEDMKGE